jgi:hypothetical protein
MFIDISTYGAIPDSEAAAATNTTAIQAALDAATYHSIVTVPGHTYWVNGELKPNRGARLYGVSPSASVLKAASTFDVSAGNEAAIIHQYRDASPVLYAVGGPTDRIYFDNILVDGNSVAGVNGILASLQQPAAWSNVRVQNCPGYGIALCDTMQAVFYNTESVGNGRNLEMRSAMLCYFFGLDLETDSGATTTVNLSMVKQSSGGGCDFNLFSGVHMEGKLAAGNLRHIDIQNGMGNQFQTMYMASAATAESVEELFHFAATGLEERAPVYILENIAIGGNPQYMIALWDEDRGISLNSEDDFRGWIPFLVGGNENPGFDHQAIMIATRAGLKKVEGV